MKLVKINVEAAGPMAMRKKGIGRQTAINKDSADKRIRVFKTSPRALTYDEFLEFFNDLSDKELKYAKDALNDVD